MKESQSSCFGRKTAVILGGILLSLFALFAVLAALDRADRAHLERVDVASQHP